FEGRTLGEVIADDRARWLGPDLAERDPSGLPFLLKVLAIGEALSVQAHPSAEQARSGFDAENAAGIAVDAPERTYRDPGAKPEALVALVDTWVLCGFRDPLVAADLVDGLGVAVLDPLVATLRTGGPDALCDALTWLLGLEAEASTEVVGAAAAASSAAASSTSRSENRHDPRWWVAHLAAGHPDDPACLVPLLLEVLLLHPGQAVHLPAGNLHAYLEGAGVEILASSDNVLRAGLTRKHVDVDSLLAVLRFEPGVPPRPVRTEVGPGITTYDAGEAAFALARVDASAATIEIRPNGPSLLLAVGGTVDVAGIDDGVSIGHGDAAFVAPGEGPLMVTGNGTLWWATTGDALPRPREDERIGEGVEARSA
ncbi:MAG: mannose-6-phosphate isomerase, class I, partial [Acidimicrobiales bacterium]